MSDFGTLLLAVKEDGSGISASDRSGLSDKLKEIIKDGDYKNAAGEIFNHEFEEISGDDASSLVRLSEHYYGGIKEEDDTSFEFVEELETADAEEIIEKLQDKFPGYKFTCSVQQW